MKHVDWLSIETALEQEQKFIGYVPTLAGITSCRFQSVCVVCTAGLLDDLVG
jgi:hypothetical protein